MKKLFILLTIALSSGLYAETQSLDTTKQQIANKIDQKTEILKQEKDCITNAQDKQGIKQCRIAKKEKAKELKERMKGLK